MSRYLRVGGYTVAGAIPAWGVAIGRHIYSHLVGHVFCHDLGDYAFVDATSASLAISNSVNHLAG